MSQSPDKWDTFRRNLQALIIGLAALTAGAFVEVLGLTALAFIWLGLFAAGATIYALRFRAESMETKAKLLEAETRPTKIGRTYSSEVKRLGADLARTRDIAERLMVEKSELKKQLRSVESQEAQVKLQEEENAELRKRIEELENLQSSKMNVGVELQKQLRRIPNLRTYSVPLQGTQRKNFLLWQKRTIMLLEQAFGERADQVEKYLEIDFFPDRVFAIMPDEYVRRLDDAEVFLKIAIGRLES